MHSAQDFGTVNLNHSLIFFSFVSLQGILPTCQVLPMAETEIHIF